MLVLSRKIGQTLMIAEGVMVTVSEIGPDYVRLTVAAPNEAELRRRYPQSQEVPGDEETWHNRPVVVTLSLHHAALLDRLRRQMNADEEGQAPTRDDALGAILETVAENDEFPIPGLTVRQDGIR
ncbi:MAG: carbon storage regulator [Planctomycetia bacterium]|nr:carbon storage regulator [Planctomycetia bacterium]